MTKSVRTFENQKNYFINYFKIGGPLYWHEFTILVFIFPFGNNLTYEMCTYLCGIHKNALYLAKALSKVARCGREGDDREL